MARVGMLNVSRHESRHPATGRALRFHQQPEFRRPAGPRRTHAPRQSDDGGGSGDCGTLHGYKELAISVVMTVERRGVSPVPLAPGAPLDRRAEGFKLCNHFASTPASLSRSIK